LGEETTSLVESIKLQMDSLEIVFRFPSSSAPYAGNKSRLHSRVKSQTRLPSTGWKDSDSEGKKIHSYSRKQLEFLIFYYVFVTVGF
jgi:hypothetical protein